jgi:hypothetical protein
MTYFNLFDSDYFARSLGIGFFMVHINLVLVGGYDVETCRKLFNKEGKDMNLVLSN